MTVDPLCYAGLLLMGSLLVGMFVGFALSALATFFDFNMFEWWERRRSRK